MHTLDIIVAVSGSTSGSAALNLTNSGPITVPASLSGTSTLTVASSRGFTGIVNLTCAVTTSPAGVTNAPTCAFGHGTLDLTTAATSLTSTLTVSTVAATITGSYVVTVTGTDVATGKIMATTTGNLRLLRLPTLLSASTSLPAARSGATTGNTSAYRHARERLHRHCQPFLSVAGPGRNQPPTFTFNPSSVNVTGATPVPPLRLSLPPALHRHLHNHHYRHIGSNMPTTTLTVIVTAAVTPTFTLSANPNSGTITAGSSATATISVAPSGFTGTVALTCAVSRSGGVACSLSPASVIITGTTAGTSTLTITTSSNSAVLSHPLNKFFAVGGGIAVACLLFFGIPARRRSWRAILGMLLFGAIVGIGIGCGGSGNGGRRRQQRELHRHRHRNQRLLTESTTVAITVNSQ